MSRSRSTWALVGVILALGGIGLLVVPAAAAGLTTSDSVVLGVGVLALGQSYLVISRRSAPDPIVIPTPEWRTSVRVPGRRFDSRLDRLDADIRERVASAVIAARTRYHDMTGETATDVRKRLHDGAWTQDRMAASFFSPAIDPEGFYRPEWLNGEPLIHKQTRAVISELARFMSDHLDGFDPIDAAALRRRAAGDASPPGDGQTGRELTEPGEYATRRWRGVGALGLLTIAIAIFVQEPPLLLVGAVGIALTGYSAYGRAGSPQDIELTVERTVSTNTPERGDDVSVHVRVRNDGDAVLPDVRLVDGVPGGLVVSSGSPRHVATFGPGQEITFRYSVRAEFGEHTFEPMFVLLRDITGERRRVCYEQGPEVSLSCHPPPEVLQTVSVRSLTTGYPGQLTTDEGGQGIQFHETRQYQPGDPISLVDWKSLARTGQLTTMRFEEERMAKVTVMVDARQRANVSPSRGHRSSIARSIEAADILLTSLLDANNIVGITAISPTDCWVQPDRGREHRIRARELLATHPAFKPAASPGEYFVLSQLNRYRRDLETSAQVFLLTPLCDDSMRTFIERLDAGGTPITVVSPDPTTRRTTGELLAQIDRQLRIATLRDSQIPVYDWNRDDSLAVALERGRVIDG